MSIARELAKTEDMLFVIPCAGKMFKSSISKTNKALCFTINKGYFQTKTLQQMLDILDVIKDIGSDTVVFVGRIDKVRKTDGTIVYRQRVFTHSLITLFKFCKKLGVAVFIPSEFEITINNVLNVKSELKYLERYAKQFNQSITTYLTNTCILQIYNLLLYLNMYSDIFITADKILHGKTGYMMRAPFLVGRYSIDSKSSSVYVNRQITCKEAYFGLDGDVTTLDYGYTDENIALDIKKGVFE